MSTGAKGFQARFPRQICYGRVRQAPEQVITPCKFVRLWPHEVINGI